ncbi:MAG: (E)-4-hydroxy-3-methylbut-2-enyl-diphosphate synthase [Muribaculaceae bacterium]|nr:(E)-4-hydroxy-3-methylbut-2-enyl-diphosphate synthase [Muribaculaceae bacterium]
MEKQTYRRRTVPANVGNIHIGAPYPVVIQSMTTTPTLDTDASAAQTLSIARSGAELVRLTAQGVAHAANLKNIKEKVRQAGCDVPLVADIHFNPAAAFEAALHVEKVRINPGNFFDPGRKFLKMEFTDEEYAAELASIRDKFVPFLNLCRQHGTAIRVGVNHGSLSDRIMSRYGDGAEGMVESALEFLRICRDEDFTDVVVSIKASDVPLMVSTVRLLAAKLDSEGMAFPIHLGVTEAGNALEGRIKSAVGIGTLLSDGIGDTIRVSLSEDPENEVPVARLVAAYSDENARIGAEEGTLAPTAPVVRKAHSVAVMPEGSDNYVRFVFGKPGRLSAARKALKGIDKPAYVVMSYPEITSKEELTVAASIDLGSLLLSGLPSAIAIESPAVTPEEASEICRGIIQAAGIERFKAEIVACPGCGRTLYALPAVLEKIKAAFGHLKHLKIAVMGCIVNGPGEMAGADYGYVGGGPDKISLYRGTECVVKNIPQDEAVARLEELIKADGQWIDRP